MTMRVKIIQQERRPENRQCYIYTSYAYKLMGAWYIPKTYSFENWPPTGPAHQVTRAAAVVFSVSRLKHVRYFCVVVGQRRLYAIWIDPPINIHTIIKYRLTSHEPYNVCRYATKQKVYQDEPHSFIEKAITIHKIPVHLPVCQIWKQRNKIG